MIFECIPPFDVKIHNRISNTAFVIKFKDRRIIICRDGTSVGIDAWTDRDSKRAPLDGQVALSRLIDNYAKVKFLIGDFADLFKPAKS